MIAYKNRIERWFIYFILAQVPIDVFTTFVLKVVGSSLTPALVVRSVALVAMTAYLLLYRSNKVRLYTVAVGAVMVFQMYYGIYVLHGSISANVTYHFRTLYYVILFLTYFMIVKNSSKNLILKYMNYNAFFIGLVFLLATITGVYTLSYQGEARIGHQAWFASANEVSVIVSVLLFSAAYQWVKEQTWFTGTTIILLIFSNLAIGTKANALALVALGMCTLLLGGYALYKKSALRPYIVLCGVFLTIAVLAVVYPKFVPPVYNSYIQLELQKEINEKQQYQDGQEVPAKLAESRYTQVKPNPTGDYLSSISLSLGSDSLVFNGFYYIYGTDIRHPNYTYKEIEATNLVTGDKVVIPLTDVYNRNINNKDGYDSSFAGFTGSLYLDQIKVGDAYSLQLVQEVDGYRLAIPLTQSNLFLSKDLGNYLAVYEDRTTFFHSFVLPDNSIERPVGKSTYFFLLSNRNARVAQLASYLKANQENYLLTGSTYIGNHRDLPFVHLEMDFVELFYTYGIIGFILLIIPYGYLLAMIIFAMLRHIRRIFAQPFVILFGGAIGFVATIGFFTGTTITRPSVVIYLALFFSVLYHHFYTWKKARS